MTGISADIDSADVERRRDDGVMWVSSSDHVSLAVHEFGGSGRPLLFSHATGFHGYCYLPIAEALADDFTSFAVDYRGHGDTARPADWQVDWDRYGDDALAAARAVAPNGGLVGFGHSMGGASLLMAAHRDPDLFDVIVVFEPIVFPPPLDRPDDGSEISVGARRRRASFASFEDAIENYASKPPMMAFDREVLRLYVTHGFRPAPEGVRLKCDPEHEARTFEASMVQHTWDLLPDIDTRVVVVSGMVDGAGPASFAALVAERLANGTFVELADADHFAPFTHPERMARIISQAVA